MKLELSVNGMTCGGCEMHVEKAVGEIQGVTEVKANHSFGKLIVKTDDTWQDDRKNQLLSEISKKVESAGYIYDGIWKHPQAKAAEKKVGNTGGFTVKQWAGIIVILTALYLVVRETGIMNRLPVLEGTMGYGLLFVVGLMTSVHCIGMCGGINLSVSVSGVRGENSKKSTMKRVVPAIFYNTGRVVSYTAVGGFVGALGSVIAISGNAQGIIVGAAGVFMALMGIRMLGLFPWLDRIIPKMPKGLSSRIQGGGRGKGPFIVGLLNGFMPCGPLQSVQIYALGTGSAVSGALSMFLFSLGTVPLMLGFGSITSILPPKFHRKILHVSALLVLLLGGGMVLRGMSLSGVSLLSAGRFTAGSENVRVARISGDKQYVDTIMHGDEYEPFIVQAGIPVVWTITAAEKDLNGCNNPLTVPEFGIRYTMVPGENVVEFTPPAEEGSLIYTCWMGMITSGIKVVSDLETVDSSIFDEAAAMSDSSEGGCGGGNCCGNGEEGYGAGGDLLRVDYPDISPDKIAFASIADGKQHIKISIDESGFVPAVIVMQKGLETIWELDGKVLTQENYRIRFPAYGDQGIELAEGMNSLQLIPKFDFAYYSWQNDFGGFVKAVDDIEMVDVEEIRLAVNAFNEQS